MYKDYLSNKIITFPNYKDKVLYSLSTDNSNKIEYRMNEHGYRSESLTKKGKLNILTLGCSWTMGVGVDNDKIWPSLIQKKYEDSVVCNYGMYGTSTEFLAKQYCRIIESGYEPNIVLILWPGLSRRDYLDEEGRHIKLFGWRTAYHQDPVSKGRPDIDLAFVTLQNDYQDLNVFWSSYKFVQSITPKNTKVFHSIAGYYYEIFDKHFESIKEFIDLDNFFIPSNCYQNDRGAVDGSHPSSEWHNKFSNQFYHFIRNSC